MTLRTRTFQCGDAQVTIREPKGIDRIDQRLVYPKLTYDRKSERDRTRATRFAEMVSQTVSIVGNMGYPWATVDSDETAMQAAFDAWVEWPDEIMSKWITEFYLVGQSPGEPATQPDADPNA